MTGGWMMTERMMFGIDESCEWNAYEDQDESSMSDEQRNIKSYCHFACSTFDLNFVAQDVDASQRNRNRIAKPR